MPRAPLLDLSTHVASRIAVTRLAGRRNPDPCSRGYRFHTPNPFCKLSSAIGISHYLQLWHLLDRESSSVNNSHQLGSVAPRAEECRQVPTANTRTVSQRGADTVHKAAAQPDNSQRQRHIAKLPQRSCVHPCGITTLIQEHSERWQRAFKHARDT